MMHGQKKHQVIHTSGGIRTHNPSKWADADPRLKSAATGISFNKYGD